MWREEAQLSMKLDGLKQSFQKSERSLFSSLARNTSRGLRSVAAIVDRLKIKGYHGPLYELFSVDESLQSAVEVVAGNSLFHIVVDNDGVATSILKVLNEERGGRVTFMPLNNLQPKDVEYPESDEAIPVLSRLEFDDKFRPAMKQVFGRAVLSKNLEDAGRFARSHKLTGVTFDGDRADKRGAMTGGFIDHRQSRLESIRALQESKQEYCHANNSVEQLKAKIKAADQKILEVRDKIAGLENESRSLSKNRSILITEQSSKQRRLNELENSNSDKNRNLISLLSTIGTLNSEIEAAKKELGTPLSRKLSGAETKELETLPTIIERKMADLKKTVQLRTDIEMRKLMLESEISDNLSLRLRDVEKSLTTVESKSTSSSKLQGKKKELESVLNDLSILQNRVNEADKELADVDKTFFKESQRLEKLRALQTEANLAIERQQIVMNKFLTRKSLLSQKKLNAVNAIRALGILPEDAFEKYDHLSEREISEKLHTVNGLLKKFEGVNRKAYEQYESFTRQKETLEGRKTDLDESAQVSLIYVRAFKI